MNIQEIQNFISKEFKQLKNEDDAKWRTAYMKNQFAFLGVRSPKIKEVMKNLLKKYPLSTEEIFNLSITLYKNKEYREYKYLAIYLLEKIAKNLNQTYLSKLEEIAIIDPMVGQYRPSISKYYRNILKRYTQRAKKTIFR